jgi:hypothetical protein
MRTGKRQIAVSPASGGIEVGTVCTFNAEFAHIYGFQNPKPLQALR